MNPLSMDIPGYKIEKLLAEGGMASVYLAQQESLGRPVALKLLRKFDNASQAARFFNEGRIIASLEHRNIITIFDLGVVGERHYLAMEFLQGGDLRSRIDGGMTPPEALELVETLSSCLSFVHQKGIIHRDIKPENILFRQDGSVVLTDFGVAKQMETHNSTLTMDGIALGSPHYLSPEQAQCKALDGRADIYSLGIICYEMLTGLKPFQGDSPLEIIIANLTSERPHLPPHLSFCQPLLSRMIAQNPADRFVSATELVDHVRQLRAFMPKRKWLKIPAPTSQPDKAPISVTQTIEMPFASTETAAAPKTANYKRVLAASGLLFTALLAVLLGRHFLWLPSPKQSPQVENIKTAPSSVQISPTEIQKVPVNPAVPIPATEPMPTVQLPLTDTKTRLKHASAILRDKRLTLPKLKAAYDIYQVTLKKNPRHPEALRGINTIANQFIAIKGEIERYLVLASAAIKNDRLNAPEGSNAAGYYRRILELEPGHTQALQGLDHLAGVYAERAEAHLRKSESAEAERNWRIGLRLNAGHPRLQALASRFNKTDAQSDTDTRSTP